MTLRTAAAQPHTALALLVGGDVPEPELGRLWDGPTGAGVQAALNRIEPVLRAATKLEITKAASALLQLDLIGMLVDGWRKYEDLLVVARRGLETPGSTELAELASHRVTVGAHPYIDVVVDGKTIATVRLELTVVFDVTVLAVSVRDGAIVALHAGRTDITATLTVDGVKAPVGHEVVDLPLTVVLGDGIPLLEPGDEPRESVR
jgi:hypothetical protein